MVASERGAGGDLFLHVVSFDPPQDGSLQTAEAEVEGIALHLGERKANRLRIAERRQCIYHRTARVAEAEQFAHFIEGLAGRVVSRFAEHPVAEALQHLEQVRVPSAYDER